MPAARTESGPTYRTIGVPEIDDNPLLAHLRLPPETDDDAFLALGLQANFDPNERELPTSIRRLRVNRLRRFFIPVQPAHRRALIGIGSQLFDGYMARNPMTPEGQRILYGEPVASQFRSTISFLAGHSGMGKSALMDQVLAYWGDQVCRHTSFRGESFPEAQLLWLRRNLPEYCTASNLCSTFGDHTDHVLGTAHYSRVFAKIRPHGNLYMREMRKIITDHHVGMMVLDEFQNLSLMGIGAEKIISLLVNLRDELGVPIVLVGTYKALRLLEGSMSSARRLCEGGYFDLERPLSHEHEGWNALCEAAWKYQWIRNPADYSPEISAALYDVSQGITGIMLSVLSTAQLAAMEDDGDETVNADLIRRVYRERMKPLHSAVRVLQSGDPRLMDKFDDLYQNAYPTINRGEDNIGDVQLANEVDESLGADTEISSDTLGTKPPLRSGRRKSKTITPSPGMTQEQIEKLVTADSISDLIALLE